MCQSGLGQWTESYSFYGLNWLTVGAFTYNLMVTSVMIFAGYYDTMEHSCTVFIDDLRV